MSGRKKRRQKNTGGQGAIELNVMPFVDVFSLLTTFLLFSAVFVQIGLHEVQVPFLSNSNPPDMSKPTRDFEVKIDVLPQTVEIQTSYTQPPLNAQTYKFGLNDKEIYKMHQKLVQLRVENPKNDKVTLFADDAVTYNDLAKILDAVKFLNENDPKDIEQPKNAQGFVTGSQLYLYSKVVMGSVML